MTHIEFSILSLFQQPINNVDNRAGEQTHVYSNSIKPSSEQREKGKEKITFLAHNGKTVAVYLSANTGLYGDIVRKTFDLFMKDAQTGGIEATIVGKHGLGLFYPEMRKAQLLKLHWKQVLRL